MPLAAVDLSLPLTHPVLIVAAAMAVILLAPLVMARLRLPGAVGLILAGVAIGPNALGLLDRDPTMVLLGTVGLLYIMFVAGLEINLHQFKQHRQGSVVFGLATFLFPQVFGTLLGRVVLDLGWPSAILLGSVFASHTLLAYPIAARLGILRNRAVTTAVGATIITDTLALLVLAVIAGAATGGLSPLFLGQLLGSLAAVSALVMWGVPRLGAWFFRTVGRDGTSQFVFILAVVFGCAALVELIGVEAIIGAFLAGLALNRLVPEHSPLMNRIVFFGNAFFIPFFLLATGMLVDFAVLGSNPRAWLVAGSLVVAVTVTKSAAAFLMMPLLKLSRDEAGVMIGLTIPQAAATLAAVLIGFNLGLFGEGILNGTVLMILVTCILGPWLTERFGRRVRLLEESRPLAAGDRPERILVPIANPETADALVGLALQMRGEDSESPVYPLAIAPAGPDSETAVAAAERLAEHAVAHATSADVPVVPLTRLDVNAAAGIVRAIHEQRISTAVIGWNGQATPGARIFGTVLDQVLDESRAMVVVSRLVHPIETARRLLLLVPPLAAREAGFAEAVRALKTLAARGGMEVVAITEADEAEALARRLKRLPPESSLAVRGVAEWADVPDLLDEIVRAGDVLALLSVRHGALAWRPGLTRLPRVLAARFDARDLLTVYLSEVEADALARDAALGTPAAGDPAGPPLALAADHVTLGLAPDEAPALLARTLAPVLDVDLDEDARAEAADVLAELLLALPANAAPEVAPGVILYHGRTPDVPDLQVAVGVCPEGAPLPHTAQPVRVIVALVAPPALPDAAYDAAVTLAARLARAETTVEALVEAHEPEEAVAAMLAAQRGEPTPRPEEAST